MSLTRSFMFTGTRSGKVAWAFLAALAWQTTAVAPPLSANEPALNYFRIEEDWNLVLLAPIANRASPQITTEMSPTAIASYFCSFDINHRRQPEFTTGGLQVKIWQDDQSMTHKSYGTNVFSQTDDAMTWTQYMEHNGSTLKFGILKGTTSPWGDLKFAYLHVTCGDGLANLDGYRSDYSISRSAVTYGANRVNYLVLNQVRKYRVNALGQVVADIEETPRVVWQRSELE